MLRTSAALLLLVIARLSTVASGATFDETETSWKAGAATAVITPQVPLYMSGYAARKELAEGTEQDLFAKALAFEDQEGRRVVILTMDLIGVRDELRNALVEQVEKRFQVPPHCVLMNASHTHCGPAYERENALEYREDLVQTLVDLVGEALEKLEPATLSFSQARCGFAMNRRTPTENGYRNHPYPDGPVDHDVPVLRVANEEGELRAVLFGYACHNTTMGFLQWLGDYAGYAQEYFEADHPGVSAHFVTGCGGDQNPYPRRELKYAKQHGRSLATAIEAALETNQRPLEGPLKAVYETVDLEFTESDREDFPYPVQILQFGDDLAIIALGTEVVVDYSIRLKRELGKPEGPALWVAGYSNTYAGYIPSKRVLEEGGYEAVSRPWKSDLEERIIKKVHELFQTLNP